MPPRILRPRQSTGFSEYMGELDEENHAHSERLREREEAEVESLRTQFRHATDEVERHRLLAVLIPLIESTIGTGKLTLVYHDPGQRNPYFEYVPRTHRFFRLDPAGSRSIQEIHFSDKPTREPYTFSRLNLDTGRHVRSTMSGRSAINVQNSFAPLPQRSIGHRLAAIHGIDRDVWMENAMV